MIGSLVFIGVGILTFVNGLKAFGCGSVSFFSRNLVSCFEAGPGISGGAISGRLAGIGLVGGGVMLVTIGLFGLTARLR